MLKILGACRFVYNYYLNIQMNAYWQTGKNIPFTDLSRDLTVMRNRGDYPWLKELQVVPMQQSLRMLDVAFSKFFRKTSELPRFKSKRDMRQSFRKHQDWKIRDNKIQIQSDLLVKYRGKLSPDRDQMKTLTISRTPTGKWYASIQVIEQVEQPSKLEGSVGIDLGLTHTAITSDGQKFENLKLHKRQLKRLKALQQSLSRKHKGSNRREKARLEIARLHEKIANQRMNHLHQVSSAITGKNHALIAVEDLSVANMLKNRSLSRSIADVSWSELIRQIEYKQMWKGGQFVKVGRFYPSSKTCSNCGVVRDSLPLDVRSWDCECGTTHDRDVNAARNILKQAEAQLGVESTEGHRKVEITGSVKRGYATA